MLSFTVASLQSSPSFGISERAYFSNPINLVAERNQKNFVISKVSITPSFEIIEDIKKSNIKRSVTIRLTNKVSKETLYKIAKYIKSNDRKTYKRTFILYYLPKMEIGAGAWATTHFNPTLKVNILGLTLEEEVVLKSKTKNVNRNEIGSWITESFPGILTIYKEKKAYFLEWRFNDGSKLNREVIKKSSSKGIRFERKNETRGEYFIVNNDNNLESWANSGLLSISKSVSK